MRDLWPLWKGLALIQKVNRGGTGWHRSRPLEPRVDLRTEAWQPSRGTCEDQASPPSSWAVACPQGQMWLPHPVSGELASRIAGVETARRASQSPQGVSQPGTYILPFLPRHCAHLCPATPERPCGPGSLLSPGKPGLAERTPAPPCPLRAPALTAPSACRDSRPSGRCWAHRRSASSCGAGSASWWPRGRQTQVRASPAPLAPSRPSWPPPASCGLLSSHVRASSPCGVRASPGEQCWPVGVALPGLGLPCREWGFMRAPQVMPIK